MQTRKYSCIRMALLSWLLKWPVNRTFPYLYISAWSRNPSVTNTCATQSIQRLPTWRNETPLKVLGSGCRLKSGCEPMQISIMGLPTTCCSFFKSTAVHKYYGSCGLWWFRGNRLVYWGLRKWDDVLWYRPLQYFIVEWSPSSFRAVGIIMCARAVTRFAISYYKLDLMKRWICRRIHMCG